MTPFNKFMLAELARLSEAHPDLSHQERFKMATENWKAKR
ncbi:HMG-box domain-containing protein [Streptomyces sp. NPDC087297]